MSTDMYRFTVSMDDRLKERVLDFYYTERFRHRSNATAYLMTQGLDLEDALNQSASKEEFLSWAEEVYKSREMDLDQETKKGDSFEVWARVGMRLQLSEEEFSQLLALDVLEYNESDVGGNGLTLSDELIDLFVSRGIPDGDSYIPDAGDGLTINRNTVKKELER